MPELTFCPVDRDTARRFVNEHHRHHDAHHVDIFRLGARMGDELVAVWVAEQPKARALVDVLTWELSRLCVRTSAPPHTASRMLGRFGRIMDAAGCTLGVSYTRADERGSCYLAANWVPVKLVRGEAHDHGNRALRWLPGLYQPSTEIVDRVRWERGEKAGPVGCRWNGKQWEAPNA